MIDQLKTAICRLEGNRELHKCILLGTESYVAKYNLHSSSFYWIKVNLHVQKIHTTTANFNGPQIKDNRNSTNLFTRIASSPPCIVAVRRAARAGSYRFCSHKIHHHPDLASHVCQAAMKLAHGHYKNLMHAIVAALKDTQLSNNTLWGCKTKDRPPKLQNFPIAYPHESTSWDR